MVKGEKGVRRYGKTEDEWKKAERSLRKGEVKIGRPKGRASMATTTKRRNLENKTLAMSSCQQSAT